MNVFPVKSYDHKNTALKKKLLPIAVCFCLLNLNAQVTLRVEPGVLLETASENLGVLLNIEPKVKCSENTVLGLRFGIAVNPQKFVINNSSSFFIDDLDDNGMMSFVPTFDYYLNEARFRPYIGMGLGYYLFNNVDVSNRNASVNVLEGSVNNQVGFLLRGGLEIGKVRYGLEYNLIPKADIEIPIGQTIGTVDNSYFGLSIGFTIADRKNSI